jgi:hypothetical protein
VTHSCASKLETECATGDAVTITTGHTAFDVSSLRLFPFPEHASLPKAQRLASAQTLQHRLTGHTACSKLTTVELAVKTQDAPKIIFANGHESQQTACIAFTQSLQGIAVVCGVECNRSGRPPHSAVPQGGTVRLQRPTTHCVRRDYRLTCSWCMQG